MEGINNDGEKGRKKWEIYGEKELWKVQKEVGVGAEERAGFLSKVYCCPSTGWRGLRLIMRESSGA